MGLTLLEGGIFASWKSGAICQDVSPIRRFSSLAGRGDEEKKGIGEFATDVTTKSFFTIVSGGAPVAALLYQQQHPEGAAIDHHHQQHQASSSAAAAAAVVAAAAAAAPGTITLYADGGAGEAQVYLQTCKYLHQIEQIKKIVFFFRSARREMTWTWLPSWLRYL